jgi:predicted nuclease of predicted toxin-antitoxin system
VTRAVLLDENFPRSVAEGLTEAGYDVLAVALIAPGTDDRGVLSMARQGQRNLLTFDSDFGDLVFFKGEAPPPAILYFRLHPIVASEVLALALNALSGTIEGCFAVVTREGIRRRPFESPGSSPQGT